MFSFFFEKPSLGIWSRLKLAHMHQKGSSNILHTLLSFTRLYRADKSEQQAIRIKEALYDMNYAHEYSSISDRVTASQGVLSFVPSGDESLASIYEKVDQALYQAKQSGRNTYIQRNILEHSR